MATFNLEVITYKGKFMNGTVEEVVLRTSTGDMGILANHAPLVAEVATGEMIITMDGKDTNYFLSGGFLDISRERVLILADEAIDAKDIDIVQAKREAELAEAKLAKLSEEKEIVSTQKALQDALTKMRIGG